MDLQLTTDSSTSSTSSLNTFNSESKGLGIEITPAVAELGTAGTSSASSTSLLEPSPMVRTYDPSRDINKLQDEAGFFTGTGAYLTE